MEAQAAIFDHNVGPDALQQFSLRQYATRLLDKGDEKVERSTAYVDRLIVSRQQALTGKQVERPEPYSLSTMKVCPVRHVPPFPGEGRLRGCARRLSQTYLASIGPDIGS
jgi:hypothetical protein